MTSDEKRSTVAASFISSSIEYRQFMSALACIANSIEDGQLLSFSDLIKIAVFCYAKQSDPTFALPLAYNWLDAQDSDNNPSKSNSAAWEA